MTYPPDLLPRTKTVPFARALAAHGDRTALVTRDGETSYRELAARVAATAQRLGEERRLVLLAGANTTDALVVYLAALAAGHPVLLVPGDNDEAVRSLTAAYDPDVVVLPSGGEWEVRERRPVSAHDLHPDLALLLSTSGSTGSPKLVRLSHENLQANAESIAEYLGIRDGDRAATTLPMHYCYGLSVINSHLLRGAGLILTDLSVADGCFWELFRRARGSTFAGVPYTFDLLDRIGFAGMDLPHLRYVTQAGGRLAPERVAEYAATGRQGGWDLFVMYGQTEATARMAYLPPHLAESRPQAVGVPVPGGSFRLLPLPDRPGEDDTGELVYTGPNVMLGYAETPADLSLGRTVRELRTGDVARRAADGLYEIVGRRSRFAKILGLRVDPQQVEVLLERHGITSYCVGGDGELLVAVVGDADAQQVRRTVADACGLPRRAVRVHLLPELPRLPTGKPDYAAVRRLASADDGRPAPSGGARPPAPGPEQGTKPAPEPGQEPEPGERASADRAGLCRLYAEILDRTDVTEDSSFVGLGGDSLCYVEMSLRLEEALGHLPADWHTLPIRDLEPAPRPEPAGGRGTAGGPGEAGGRPAPARRPAARRRVLETGVALRAVAIVLVVGSHIPLFLVQGGAHVLLGLAGFNFARFHLTPAGRRERIRHAVNSVVRIAVPSAVWIALVVLVTDKYEVANVFLLNTVIGSYEGRTHWHYWFVEAVVHILVVVTALLAVPAVDRAERRFPFALPVALAALGLVTRYDLPGFDQRAPHLTPVVVLWLFALGWAAAKASSARQRLLVTAAVLATVPGFFGQPQREAVVVAGLVLLIWVPSLPSLGVLNRAAGVLASSSLYIYLVHWQVYPHLADRSALLALLASLAAGIACAAVATRLVRRIPSLVRNRTEETPAPRTE